MLLRGPPIHEGTGPRELEMQPPLGPGNYQELGQLRWSRRPQASDRPKPSAEIKACFSDLGDLKGRLRPVHQAAISQSLNLLNVVPQTWLSAQDSVTKVAIPPFH